MRYALTIDLDNDAFQPDFKEELARLLLEEAKIIIKRGLDKDEAHTLYDINGNLVGRAKLHE